MTVEDRFIHVTLAGIERVDRGSLWLFLVACCLGRIRGTEGFHALSTSNRAVGVDLAPVQRDRVLERTGASRQRWAKVTKSWVSQRMAHRCRRGQIFLFLEPRNGGGASCPACLSSLVELANHDGSNMTTEGSQTPVPRGVVYGEKEGEENLLAQLDENEALVNAMKVLRASRAAS